jgi:tol-pal system protein YbgF
MKRSAIILLIALALPVQAARAGIFDDKEARASIDKLRADVDSLTVRVERATKNQIDFANQAEAMKADLAHIRGQLEVLLNDMEATQKRQRDFYVDLDSRLRKLEAATAPSPEAKPADVAPKADPAQEGREYEAALSAFKAAKYKEAGAAFMAFANAHPGSSLLPNAYYWAGSSQYQQKEFAKAAETFGKVAATWPNEPKAADALLAQGNALAEVGDSRGSRKAFEKLVAQYPASPAAQTAKQRLKKK